jgi:PAS domain-containing protein
VNSREPAFHQGGVTVAANELPASLAARVFEASAAPMILFENRAYDCVVRYVNPAFAHRTGYTMAEIAQIRWDGMHMDGADERGLALLRAAIREQRELEIPLRIRGKNGRHLARVTAGRSGHEHSKICHRRAPRPVCGHRIRQPPRA